MNVWSVTRKFARSELNALIYPAVSRAPALRAITVILTMDSVHQHNANVLPIRNVAQMRNVYSLENVSVHHHSSWIPTTITSVKVLANDSLVVSMPSAHQLIHRSVCANQDSKVIRLWVVPMRMNARTCLALTVLTVLTRRAVINVFVRKVSQAIHTRAVVFWKLEYRRVSALPMKIVQAIWLAWKVLVCRLAPAYFADRMHFVKPKTMPAGVAVASVIAKIKTAIVYHSARILFVVKALFAYQHQKDQPVNAHKVTSVIHFLAAHARRINVVLHVHALSVRFVSMADVRNAVKAWFVVLVLLVTRVVANVFVNPILSAIRISCVCHRLSMPNVNRNVVRMHTANMVSEIACALVTLALRATPMKVVVHKTRIFAHQIAVAQMLNVARMVNKSVVSVRKDSLVMPTLAAKMWMNV